MEKFAHINEAFRFICAHSTWFTFSLNADLRSEEKTRRAEWNEVRSTQKSSELYIGKRKKKFILSASAMLIYFNPKYLSHDTKTTFILISSVRRGVTSKPNGNIKKNQPRIKISAILSSLRQFYIHEKFTNSPPPSPYVTV